MSVPELQPWAVDDTLVDDLRAAYATPPRHYHTWGHALEVLGHWRTVSWDHPREALLAVLFHDAVYDVHRDDNEAASARLARERLAGWPVDVERVAWLIELTAGHGKGHEGLDEDARRFLDCDMAVLGADWARFQAYEEGVRAEYSARYPGPLFRFGRRRFLEELLASERIYLSEVFAGRYEASARANLARALGR